MYPSPANRASGFPWCGKGVSQAAELAERGSAELAERGSAGLAERGSAELAERGSAELAERGRGIREDLRRRWLVLEYVHFLFSCGKVALLLRCR